MPFTPAVTKSKVSVTGPMEPEIYIRFKIDLRTSVPLPRVIFAVLGFLPITCLCLALFGLVPLHLSLKFIVLPAAVLGIILGLLYPRWGRLALTGLVAGMLATVAYDVFRLGLMQMGVWGDFIPVIGKMALQDVHASPIWGYLWRYVGNGGCMGVTFAMLPWMGTSIGMVYGSFICYALFSTLLVAPGAQAMLFHLKSSTVAGAMAGHLIYGGVLGWLMARWHPGEAVKPRMARTVVTPPGYRPIKAEAFLRIVAARQADAAARDQPTP